LQQLLNRQDLLKSNTPSSALFRLSKITVFATTAEQFQFFCCAEKNILYFCAGEMAEWSIAAVLKTVGV
jgi:hypothetical protein